MHHAPARMRHARAQECFYTSQSGCYVRRDDVADRQQFVTETLLAMDLVLIGDVGGVVLVLCVGFVCWFCAPPRFTRG
jgi:hypothetical protein